MPLLAVCRDSVAPPNSDLRPRYAKGVPPMEVAGFYEDFADWIEYHLEHWTVTNNGMLRFNRKLALT